jgi:hypothetical protein
LFQTCLQPFGLDTLPAFQKRQVVGIENEHVSPSAPLPLRAGAMCGTPGPASWASRAPGRSRVARHCSNSIAIFRALEIANQHTVAGLGRRLRRLFSRKPECLAQLS